MRQVISISLPQSLTTVIDTEVETGRYATRSEFFRSLLRMWMEVKLARDLSRSRDEFVDGQGKLLTSLSELR